MDPLYKTDPTEPKLDISPEPFYATDVIDPILLSFLPIAPETPLALPKKPVTSLKIESPSYASDITLLASPNIFPTLESPPYTVPRPFS